MIRILKHQTHLPSQPSHASPARVLLVDQDPTTTWPQQTVQMLGKSSLPGTVLPHDGNKFSGFEFDADSRQGFSPARRILERNILNQYQVLNFPPNFSAAASTTLGVWPETSPSRFSIAHSSLTLGTPTPNPVTWSNCPSKTS